MRKMAGEGGQARPYTITRILNHNVVLVEESCSSQEIVLFGKGIGYGIKPGETVQVTDARVEKRFRLEQEHHQVQYQAMLNQVDPAVVGIAEEIIALVAQEITPVLNEHVHVALPDHIHFAIYRLRNGLEIVNPFLFEVQALYPKEYLLAGRAGEMIQKAFSLGIPESEIGFLALHIHAAVSHTPVNKTVQLTHWIGEWVSMIEERAQQQIDRSSVDYVRLITHLRFTVERVQQRKPIKNPLLDRVKAMIPDVYPIAEALCASIAEKLGASVPEDEVGYLALHLYRMFYRPN